MEGGWKWANDDGKIRNERAENEETGNGTTEMAKERMGVYGCENGNGEWWNDYWGMGMREWGWGNEDVGIRIVELEWGWGNGDEEMGE